MSHKSAIAIRSLIWMVGFAVVTACVSEGPSPAGNEAASLSIPRDDLAWQDSVTPLNQPGMKIAVLKGNFQESGPLVFLVSLPAGYKIPTHWHDTDEDIVVLVGSIYMGGGDGKPMGKSDGIFYRKGGTHHLPAKTLHWFFTTDESVVIKIRSSGPFRTHWIPQ